MAVALIQFCFTFTLSCLQTNLPLTLVKKFSFSVASIGYLNSLQSLTGALVGFAVGPVLKHVYKGNNKKLLIQASMLEVVSQLIFIE
jgi:hypothetical protein